MNKVYKMDMFVCMELELMYIDESTCLHGIGYMKIHCHMSQFLRMELA